VPIRIGGTSGAWAPDGTIVFTPSNTVPLFRIETGGGAAVQLTRLEPPQTGHRYPHFLPDGRHFLFFALGPADVKGVSVGSLDSADIHRLFPSDSGAVFVPPDWVLFAREGALLAQRLDLNAMTPSGDPVPVAPRVAASPNRFGSVALSASAAGPVAYRARGEARQLVWLDRSGRRVGALGPPDEAQPLDIRLSRDGQAVALYRREGGHTEMWLRETARDALRRVTADPAIKINPIWSPDGRRLVFSSNLTGILDLHEQPVDGSGPSTVLLASSEHKNAGDWSPHGRHILYELQTAGAGRDLWALPLFGDRTPFGVVQGPFEEAAGRFSPDGAWIAYQSTETGRNEIYVQPFPGPGAGLQISTTGGSAPAWRDDGRELFYLADDNRLTVVPLGPDGATLAPGVPSPLFSLPAGSEYVVAPGGQQFLVNVVVENPSPITVLLNWRPR
jgi:dipeptidyl aminopeptidase/acylaminoacyl peptidase